jgi:type I restriction enzyme M protein
MAGDGFSLDDKRTPGAANDIPDVLLCWKNRADAKFLKKGGQRLEELRSQVAPLKAERLKLQAEINRLTFESVIAPAAPSGLRPPPPNSQNLGEAGREPLADAQARLAKLQSQISNPQSEIDQLSRQFWVTKAQVKANKYDLSASRYRQVEVDAAYHESPQVTLERLTLLEQVMSDELIELREMLN